MDSVWMSRLIAGDDSTKGFQLTMNEHSTRSDNIINKPDLNFCLYYQLNLQQLQQLT